jgi:hypothetical protein
MLKHRSYLVCGLRVVSAPDVTGASVLLSEISSENLNNKHMIIILTSLDDAVSSSDNFVSKRGITNE